MGIRRALEMVLDGYLHGTSRVLDGCPTSTVCVLEGYSKGISLVLERVLDGHWNCN